MQDEELIERQSEWQKLEARANLETADVQDDAAAIGERDGFSRAVQLIDELTGGDGEYCYCLGMEDSERHCPDPDAMIDRILGRLEALAQPVVGDEGRRPGMLGYHSMGSGGRCDWTHLREAVSEATCGSRTASTPFDPSYYPGHQSVTGINYNSLDRIVTAFVDAAILSSTPVMSVSWEVAKAYRNCAEMNRQMAGTIGAAPGSSIFAALEACAERMDEIALSTPVTQP